MPEITTRLSIALADRYLATWTPWFARNSQFTKHQLHPHHRIAPLNSLSPTPELPEDFAALPSEQQERILRAGYLMNQMAFRHAGAVTVAPPPSVGGKVKNGSGFVLELNGAYYFGTAWHVVEEWLNRTGEGENVVFEVRDTLLDPRESIAWKDEANDIAFLAITAEQLNGIDISVCEPLTGWPPPHPKKGSYVLVVGFPAVLREQPRQDRLEFNSLSAMLQVTSVAERQIVCQFERAHWVSYNPNGVPLPGTDLGGMSGGPVFGVGNLAFPLVGLVSEFSIDFELLYIKTLSHVPSEF